MYRGIIKFVCDDCGNKFKAPDIEWGPQIIVLHSHARSVEECIQDQIVP